ncbi:OsmC family protein [Thiohalorhabdus sp.]|uniref:OsmC family protein n=1 Tax=Thiohalorhabdus sp. TaxID=3094134 RepID=UPI002FC28F40
MKCDVKWVDGAQFLGESDSGHPVVMDGPPDGGGRNMGVRPMEMMLLGVGGCTAYDVVHILQKQRQPVTDCQVTLEAERADTDPKIFTKINIHFTVTGEGLSEKQVARAVELSAEKYCSASAQLAPSCTIGHSHEIVESKE